MEKLDVLMCGFKKVSKRFDWSLQKSNVFETGWWEGLNQLLQFWNERFSSVAGQVCRTLLKTRRAVFRRCWYFVGVFSKKGY